MTRRVRRTWFALFAAILTVLFASGAEAAFEFDDTSWEGCSEFIRLAKELLGAERVLPVTTLDWQALTSNDAVLLVHPTTPLDPDEAAAFMRLGGRLGVIDDYGSGDLLLTNFKLSRRRLPRHPSRFLRGNTELAIATPAFEPGAVQGPGVHPTVVDVGAVVLNHGTGFEHPDLTAVLEVRGADDAAGSVPDAAAVAVAGQVDRGRLFAVGDPSAFMNLMLRYPGNRAFAKGVLRYLADGDANQPRGGKLYVLVNDFGETNSFSGETPLRKALERNLRLLAAGLRELRTNGFPWWFHTVLAAMLAFSMLGWTARALMKLYAPRLPRFAREVPMAAQGGVAGRVAVLAAPGTSLDLAMLELRNALVEGLALRLSRPETTPLEELLEAAHAKGDIDDDAYERAKAIAARIRVSEVTIANGGRSRLKQADVVDAGRWIDAVLGR
jgi:hypothetical protein